MLAAVRQKLDAMQYAAAELRSSGTFLLQVSKVEQFAKWSAPRVLRYRAAKYADPLASHQLV